MVVLDSTPFLSFSTLHCGICTKNSVLALRYNFWGQNRTNHTQCLASFLYNLGCMTLAKCSFLVIIHSYERHNWHIMKIPTLEITCIQLFPLITSLSRWPWHFRTLSNVYHHIMYICTVMFLCSRLANQWSKLRLPSCSKLMRHRCAGAPRYR